MTNGRFAALGLTVVLMFVADVRAQQLPPHLGYVFPAGGQRGTTLQATIGGQYLVGASRLVISGSGVQAEVVEYTRPLSQKQFNDLRDRLRELRTKPKNEEVLKEIAEIQKSAASYAKRASPVLAENVTIRLTLAPDAEPGQRELRLEAASGLSNPLVFQVGQRPEFTEKEEPPRRDPRTGKLLPRELLKKDWGIDVGAKPQDMDISLPATINGQIMPGDVDRYRFEAHKGQQLVVAACARELMPYLADAVPGWFQAAVALYDSGGNEVAYEDHYRFHPDPVLFYKIPRDGPYVLEVKDALYRGREDFVYRASLSEQPFITSVFPLGSPAGSQTTVALTGGNLPVKKLTMDARDKSPGIYPLSVRNGKQDSNQVLFAVDTLPECQEQEPNDDQARAQRVTLPMIVNGRTGQPGDWDVFCFNGRAGEKIVAEVDARRLDSPLDSVLKLTDAAGRQLALNDDHEDKEDGLNTHHADSLVLTTLPADGTYYAHLSDAQHRGGTTFGYRLRISQPRPDFELRVVPSTISARAGMSVPVTVYALRRDGFSGEISLALKDTPSEFTLSGARVPANQDQIRLTLMIPPAGGEGPLSLHLEGRAIIGGQETRHPAVAADDMMQAFAYRHLVPAKSWMVAVLGRGRPSPPVKLLGQRPVMLPMGGTATIRFAVPRGPLVDQVQLALSDPPEGIVIQNVSRSEEKLTIHVHADPEKVKPGLKGNLIVDAFLERETKSRDGKPRAAKQRVRLGTLPAIPFEIVAQR